MILTFKDGNGIVKLNDPLNLYAYRFNNYSNNHHFIEVKLSDSSKVIIFLGQHYGTDLAELIIFVATDSDIKLVYCKAMEINSIVKTADSFSMTIQSNIIEDGVGVPRLQTIWSQYGFLWFKYN